MRGARCVWMVVLLAAACDHHGHGDAAPGGGAKSEEDAMAQERKLDAAKLEVGKIAEDAPFQAPQVEVMESQPVQFAITFTKQMPTPGYEVKVEEMRVLPTDSISDPKPKPAAREWAIRVKIHEKPPDGPAPTVLDPMRIRIALGPLKTGAYRLHLMVRGGDEKEHKVAQAIELVAK